MKNVFNDSDDTISDDASFPSRRLSHSHVLNIEENDDTTEKRANRKSIVEKVPNAIILNNQKSDVPQSQNDIGNHYGNCIKLASENKINSKNAFSLHLIDYLQDFVKELHHFQTVGSSLDAGTKIYASRVDSVFTNTYQVLSGLGNPNEDSSDKKDDETPIENNVSDQEEESKIKKPRRKINKVKKTIVQNIKKIRINPAQLQSEVDPIFQSQAGNFDDGGNSELRLNNLTLLDRTFELALDSETIVYTNITDITDTKADENEVIYDISSFLPQLKEISEGNIKMCDQFEDFQFCGWKEGTEAMNSVTAESLREMLAKTEMGVEGNNIPNDESVYGMDAYEQHGFDDEEYSAIVPEFNEQAQVVEPPVAAATALEEDNDNMITLGTDKAADSCNGNILMSSVMDLVNSLVEQYGEENQEIIGMLAGPNLWKKKTQSTKLIKIDSKSKPVVVRQPKEIKPIFPEKIMTLLNEQGIGRMAVKKGWKMTKNELVSTQLTDACLKKNVDKTYLLPATSRFSFKSLNQLMNREVLLVNKALKKKTEEIQNAQSLDGEKVLNSEVNQASDVFEIQPVTLITDDIGNINNDYQEDDNLSDCDAYMGTSFHDNFDAIEDPVTANVRHIEQIDIDYAKTAKRIDVKNIKARMWSILQTSIDAIDIKIIQEKKYPNLHMSTKTCLFSQLIKDLVGQLKPEQSKDLSVAILTTCLMLLTNETGLNICSTEDNNDLVISQGYSEYDIEQIKLFGVGNTRKRQSGARCKKSTHFYSDEEDDEDEF